MMTGRLPFEAKSKIRLVLKHIEEEPPLPSEIDSKVDLRLEAICMKALEKRREDRYQTAREMRIDVRGGARRTRRSRPRSRSTPPRKREKKAEQLPPAVGAPGPGHGPRSAATPLRRFRARAQAAGHGPRPDDDDPGSERDEGSAERGAQAPRDEQRAARPPDQSAPRPPPTGGHRAAARPSCGRRASDERSCGHRRRDRRLARDASRSACCARGLRSDADEQPVREVPLEARAQDLVGRELDVVLDALELEALLRRCRRR